METKTLLTFLQKRPPAQSVITFASHDKILQTMSCGEVINIIKEIKLFLKKSIKEESSCIALFMQKNILLPSIIICLQDLQLAFIFLTAEKVKDSPEKLHVKWILSMNERVPLLEKNFILKDTITITATGDELYLWLSTNLENTKERNDYYKNIFCVMQTSGSTGENKVVKVPFDCIQTNVEHLNKNFRISAKDVIYWGTPLTFDPSLVELLLAVIFGSTLLIVPPVTQLNPFLLYQSLFHMGSTTFLQMVPSMFLRWSSKEISKILLNSSLRVLAFGGEVFPKEVLKFSRNPSLQIFNLYGVTELSCWATIYDATKHPYEKIVPLGVPLTDTFVNIENSEICVGSHSRHCLVNDDSSISGPFVVKTGDLGQWQDGLLFYLGRKSRTFKRFGHKVVLHNMEYLILKEVGLQSRFVYQAVNKKLLLFILIDEVPNRESTKIRMLDKLRVKILNILPEHAFPDFLDILSHFPLTSHGKICENSLVEIYEQSTHSTNRECNTESIFNGLLERYLKSDFKHNSQHLTKYTFNELGGNSLLTVQFLEAFESEIGAKAPDQFISLLLNATIEECLRFAKQNVRFKRELHIADAGESRNPKQCKLDIFNIRDYVVWSYDLKSCVDASCVAFERQNVSYVACGSFAHRFAILTSNGTHYFSSIFPKEITAQPAVSKDGELLFVGCADGGMYCINVDLKKIMWEFKTDHEIKGSACICNEASLVFGSYDEHLYCLNVHTGSLTWKTKTNGHIKSDVIYDDTSKIVYAGTTKGTAYAVNELDGVVVWFVDLGEPIFGAPCLVNGRSIWATVHGKVYVDLPEDGSRFIQVGGHIFSSLRPHPGSSSLYFGCHDSYLYRIDLSNKPEVSKIAQLESEISSTPFLHEENGNIFLIAVCNMGILYVVDILKKKTVFKSPLPGPTFSSPYVFDMKVYIGCRDNNLYCIDLQKALIDASR